MPAPRGLTEPELKRQAEVLRRRADTIDAALAERQKHRADAMAEAAKSREDQRDRQARLWARSSPEKEQYEF